MGAGGDAASSTERGGAGPRYRPPGGARLASAGAGEGAGLVDASDRDALAVQQLRRGKPLDGVPYRTRHGPVVDALEAARRARETKAVLADGVAEVECRPDAALLLVERDHLRLEPHRLRHHLEGEGGPGQRQGNGRRRLLCAPAGRVSPARWRPAAAP